MAALMGGTFGTMITWPICGVIIENMGWDWSFYMVGIFVVIVCAAWFVFVAESPAQHSTISIKERELIEKSLGDTVSTKKVILNFVFKFKTKLANNPYLMNETPPVYLTSFPALAAIQSLDTFYAVLVVDVAPLW